MSDTRVKSTAGWRELKGTLDGRAVITQQIQEIEDAKVLSATTDYAAEDVLSDSAASAWSFHNVPSKGKIHDMKITLSPTGLAWRMSLYFYRAKPTSNLTDNTANTGPSVADRSLYTGVRIDFPDTEDLGGMSETEVSPSTVGNMPQYYDLKGGTTLYGILVLRDAETGETANMVAAITGHMEPVE